MASSVQIPVTQTGLEASIQAALKNAGKNATINLGANARQINALSQPLGRITGQADEFTKSMEAANARVFAFGASVGIINTVSNAFGALVKNTIAVEKSLVEINSVLGKSSSELDKFGSDLFNIAKNTGQSFEAVSKGALELARQGLKPVETLQRLNDALILTRLSGLDAGKSVEGLTSAVNSFKSTGITTSEVLNKLVNVSQKYAVSEKDLIEGLKRSSSVAKQAGVSFDELVGVITAVQEKSAVGGAVIGTSFKTIFSRLQKRDTLDALQQLGVEVTDVQGKILPATRLLENLAVKIKSLDQIQIAQITEKVGGGYQIDKLISALDDMGSKGSIAFEATKISAESANQAYAKNAALNKTLANLINETTLSAQELGATLGKLGITDSAKNLLGFFNSLLESIQKVLGEESAIGDIFRGLAKGIGNLITGPGLALFGAIILKLSKDLAQFGFSSLKSFFGIGKAAKEIEAVEKSVANALSTNIGLQRQLFALEGNRAAQIKVMTDAIVQQEAAMRRMASTSSSLAGPLYQQGVRGTNTGLRVPKAAGGYMPAVAQESSDINRGVGGARSGDRPVVIPNFNFGGGQRGSIVAHTGEYAVPNFAGSGGTAIFNRDMVRSMGLPSGAKKIGAAGGLIPNFAKVSEIAKYFSTTLMPKINISQSSDGRLSKDDNINLIGNRYQKLYVPLNKGESTSAYEKRVAEKYGYTTGGMFGSGNSAVDGFKGSTSLLEVKSGGFNSSDVKLKFLRANIENYGSNLPLDVWTKNKDDIKVNGLLVHSDEKDIKKSSSANVLKKDLINSDVYRSNKYGRPRKIDDFGKYIKNLSSGFIPNFAFNADTVRQYASDIEKYRQGGKYVFPDGTSGYESQIKNVLSRTVAKATINKQASATKRQEEMQKKGAMDFFIDANSLGGIALVTPSRRGSSGTLSAESKILNLPHKPDGVLMDDRLVIKNIQSTGVPAQKNFEQISSEINKLFAGPIVSLAQSLYGKLYSGASGSEFASQLGQLRSTSKGGILPPGAEGQIFEAAGKAALTSMNQIASAFDPSKENRPFDFTNATSMKEMLGVKAVRGDAKRAGGSEKQFKETVNGLVKKSINDPQLKSGIFSQIKQQSRGRVLPDNASGGYVPNFAIDLTKSEDFTKNQRKRSSKARTYRTASGVIGSLFKSLPDKFFSDGILGDAAQGLETDGILDLIKNNSLYAASFAGPKAVKFVLEAEKYGLKVTKGLQKKLASLTTKAVGKFKGFSSGFLPNFADPLKEAVGREMAAGVPASQIYIDKNQSLKSAANPMGLMVANRRDEPAGGHQGISRAIKEGRNPKTYGAASGFVPNYADTPDISGYVGKTRSVALAEESRNYGKAYADLITELRKATADEKKARGKNKKAAQDRIKALEDDREALKKSSEATRKAITEQSKGLRGNGKTLTGKEATVQAKGGQKDMLGTIFAVQGAMSMLTGATEGAASSAAKFTNIVSEGIGVFATAAFAIQGLSSMGGKFGTVLSKLGPYGLAAAGAFSAFSAGSKIMDEVYGITKAASSNIAKMSEAAKDAAFTFENLSDPAKQKIETSSKKLVRGAARESMTARFMADFEGSDLFTAGELEKSLTDVVKSASAAGVSYTKMWDDIREKSKDGKMTTAEVEELTNSFIKLMFTASQLKNAKRNLDLSPEGTVGKEFAGKSRQDLMTDLEKLKSGSTPDPNTAIGMIQESFLKELTDDQRIGFDINSEAVKSEILRIYDSVIDLKNAFADTSKEALDLIKTSYAQNQLKNTIDLSIAQQRTTKELDLQLLSAKELNNLSEKDIRSLENKISLRDLDRKLVDETSNILKGQIDKAKMIVTDTEKATELEEKLKDFSEDDFKNKDKVAGLLIEINTLLGSGTELTDAQRRENEQILDNLIKKYDLDKKDLELLQEKTEEYKTQASTIKDIISSAQRASQQRSFGIDIASRRSQFSNTKQITELQASKLGKSTSEIKIIDAQIAAIEANTVALENVANYNKTLEDKRGELLSLAKPTDDISTLGYAERFGEAKTIPDLIEQAKTLIGATRFNAEDNEAIKKFIQDLQQESEKLQLDSESTQAAADARTREAGAIEPVISALEMFRRSLLDSTNIIDQRIQDLELEKLTSISGRRNAEINYEIETLNQQKGKSKEEAAKIARDRQNKPLTQLLSEAFSTTEQERSMNLKNSIVDASVQFKNNMIDGISEAIEGGKSLGDVLQNSAYEFVKAINKRLMSNLVDSVVGSGKQDASGGSGFLGNIMSSIGLASGGKVNGGSGTKDDVPAMLMGGEYVINKKAVQKYGPQFLEALNNGTIGGYAKGGKVQSGKGGFFTPGTYGLGGIEGTRNLLQFATQGYTSGAMDRITNVAGYGSIALEPESIRLTNLGRSNSPQAEATRAAKEQAFGLYTQEINAQMEAAKQAEAEKDAFKKQLIMLGISAVGGAVMKAGSAGFNNALKSGGSLTEAFKGVWSGSGDFGGLKNLFSGNFAESQVGSNKELAEYILNNSDLGEREASEYSSQLTGVKNYTTPNTQSNYNIVSDTGSYEASDDLLPSKPKRATGGTIPSRGGIDTVPAMLSGGEFIMNRSAAQNIGAGNLQALNAGAGSIVTEEKTEELNDKLIAKLDELIEASGGGGSITINVEGSGGATNQTTSGQTSEQKQQLARQIKDAVVKVIQEEKRLGGSLRR
jgi:TP901 family phage tail tape measure protein